MALDFYTGQFNDLCESSVKNVCWLLVIPYKSSPLLKRGVSRQERDGEIMRPDLVSSQRLNDGYGMMDLELGQGAKKRT
jgi:hypothetical protein